MPRGAHVRFLKLLELEPRRAAIRMLRAIAVGALVVILAELVDPGRAGGLVVTTGIGLLLGLLLGGVWGLLTWRRLNESIRLGWDPWQRASEGAGGVLEAARRVDVLTPTPPNPGWALVAPALALAVAWFRTPVLSGVEGIVHGAAFLLSAMLVTAVLAHAATLAIWSRRVHGTTTELIQEGRVGVWGSI